MSSSLGREDIGRDRQRGAPAPETHGLRPVFPLPKDGDATRVPRRRRKGGATPAASRRTSGRSSTVSGSPTTSPANRFAHLRWSVTVEEWKAGYLGGWPVAGPLDIPEDAPDPRVLARHKAVQTAFISARPELLCSVPDPAAGGLGGWPSPRSWERAARCSIRSLRRKLARHLGEADSDDIGRYCERTPGTVASYLVNEPGAPRRRRAVAGA